MKPAAPEGGTTTSPKEGVQAALSAALARGRTPTRIAIAEVDVERLGAKLGRALIDELAGVAGGDAPIEQGGEWCTRIALLGGDGRELGASVLRGRRALDALPSALAVARRVGCVVDVDSAALSRRFVPTQPLGAPHPPRRSPDELVRTLRGGGWRVQTDARGASLERSKVGRQPGLMFLALLGATLFLPITMIAALAALVLEGPRRLASLARAFVSPFRHVEERIGVELQPGRLSFAVRQDRRTIVERSFDDASLLAVHAPNRFERKITLFTADELVELPCLARGEPAESFSPPESDALAELAVHVWSWPRSSD